MVRKALDGQEVVTASAETLRVEALEVRLGENLVLKEVDLAVEPGEIVALLGPSGSGKTSVLRCVAGLERAQTAFVSIDGQTWQDDAAGVFVPTWQRSLGYVFQESSLFEHMNVQANLAYGLRRSNGPASARALQEAIDLLGIGDLLDRRPLALSGGERQRVAVARALVTKPSCVLADEPTGNLDAETADTVFNLMLDIAKSQGTAFVIVTHDPLRAARCDRVLRLDHGVLKAH